MKKIIIILMLILVLPTFAIKAAFISVDIQLMFTKYAWKSLTEANKQEIKNAISLLEKNQKGNYFLPFLVTYKKEMTGVDSLDDPIAPLSELKKAAGKDAVIFTKERNSAFTKHAQRGGKPFDFGKFLKSKEIDTLIVTGLNQNACVLATVQDAVAAGLRVIVSEDMMFTSGSDAKALADPYAKEDFKQLIKKGLILVETKEEVLALLKK